MTGDEIPDEHHILRYVRPSAIADGVIDGSGFSLRPVDEGALSVNWLEAIVGTTEAQVAYIRERKRLDWKKKGLLAKLNVGEVKQKLQVLPILVVEDPLEADDHFLEDLSHSLISGFPTNVSSDQIELYQDMLAECILGSFPAEV